MMSYDDSNEDRAKAFLKIDEHTSKKKLEILTHHQLILTAIQYGVAVLLLLVGIVFYSMFDNFSIDIGTINMGGVKIQNITLSIGSVLILMSIYMIIKVTIDLNILAEGEKRNDH